MMTDPSSVARPLSLMALAFAFSCVLMPIVIRFLRKHGMGKNIRDEASAPIMASLHKAKAGTPTMGGVVVWGAVLLIALVLSTGCGMFGAASDWCGLSFLSRGQTWVPLGMMVAAALVGLVDDYWNVRRLGPKGGGLRMRQRLLSYAFIAAVGAWWFYTKLAWDQVHVPFFGTYQIGAWSILFILCVIVGTSFSVNETDGLDGLAGGALLSAFGAYAIIAWSQGRTDLATFCAVIVGALLGFLWFNVYPASVYMGDTGAMSLGTALGVVAIMTNEPLLLFLIGLPFVIETVSVLMQWTSKWLRKKKLFKSAPLHHHLEAIGWGESQIVMRFWLISFVCAGLGVVIALIGK